MHVISVAQRFIHKWDILVLNSILGYIAERVQAEWNSNRKRKLHTVEHLTMQLSLGRREIAPSKFQWNCNQNTRKLIGKRFYRTVKTFEYWKMFIRNRYFNKCEFNGLHTIHICMYIKLIVLMITMQSQNLQFGTN